MKEGNRTLVNGTSVNQPVITQFAEVSEITPTKIVAWVVLE
jgi:hypothetical protein